MRLLLDTHIFLWALAEPEKMAPERRAEVEREANIVYVSSITIAEIMIKASVGKLDVSFDPVEMIDRCGFERLPFRSEDARLLRDLPFHHRDPFDRMLIVQGLANQLPIVTEDKRFLAYPCKVV